MRRVEIGQYSQNDGYGLRVSLPGFDTRTCDPSDVLQMAFDSNWADKVDLLQSGTLIGGSSGSPTVVPYVSPGYVPALEIRRYAGNVIYDDSNLFSGGTRAWEAGGGDINASNIRVGYVVWQGLSLAYALYKVAMA